MSVSVSVSVSVAVQKTRSLELNIIKEEELHNLFCRTALFKLWVACEQLLCLSVCLFVTETVIIHTKQFAT